MLKRPFNWIVIIAAAWTVSAYVVAFQRATCGNFWSHACLASGWRGFGDAVTFTWLKDYQDAFSGMATLLAAIVAYAAVRWQVRSEARSKWVEHRRRLRDIMHLIAVEFDIANGYLKNGKRVWNGSDLAVIDQLSVEIVSYDANMLELAKRARTLISEFATDDIKAAEVMALAAHEAFLQAGNEPRPPESRRGYFNSAEVTKALAGRPITDIKDLRHYFKWG